MYTSSDEGGAMIKDECIKCPDCRDSELERINELVESKVDGLPCLVVDEWGNESYYYKCHKCKQEYEPEDIENG